MQRISVTLTWAQSLDGRIATRTGDSQWISGDETLVLSQELRKSHDAIAVGINTALRDDPLLTCRLPDCANPLRVVFDSGLRLPPDSKLTATAHETPTVVFCAPLSGLTTAGLERKSTLEDLGIRVVALPPAPSGGLSLKAALESLRGSGVASLMVEGGSTLLTAFLKEGLASRAVVVTAPIFIGSGIEAVGDLGTARLSDALRPKKSSVRPMGADAVWELEL